MDGSEGSEESRGRAFYPNHGLGFGLASQVVPDNKLDCKMHRKQKIHLWKREATKGYWQEAQTKS